MDFEKELSSHTDIHQNSSTSMSNDIIYEIFRRTDSGDTSTGIVVTSMEDAEERCAVYQDMDGGVYFYKEMMARGL